MTLKDFRKGILLIEKILILVFAVFAYMYIIFTYYPEALFYSRGNYVLALLYAFLLFVFCVTYGCFRVGVIRLKELVFSFFLTVFLSNIISYFIISLMESKLIIVLPFLLLLSVQAAVGALLYFFANRTYFWLYPARDTVVICADTERDKFIVEKFKHLKERYVIRSILYEDEGADALKAGIDTYDTVILGNIDSTLKSQLTDYGFQKRKRLFIVPTVQDIILNCAEKVQIDDSLVFLCKNRAFSMEQLILKRLVDILISMTTLVVLSPIMFLVAIAIKLQDGGSIFYKQQRITKNEKPFMLLKFRSMIENAEGESGVVQAKIDDKRITRVGKIIRAMRLDELPQLFNILRGEMSIVGPRPERVETFEEYCKVFPQFRYRIMVKAGLTGYAQIYGKYKTSLEEKLKMDLLYIERRSILMDLMLMFATIKVLFIRESSQGVEENYSNMMMD